MKVAKRLRLETMKNKIITDILFFFRRFIISGITVFGIDPTINPKHKAMPTTCTATNSALYTNSTWKRKATKNRITKIATSSIIILMFQQSLVQIQEWCRKMREKEQMEEMIKTVRANFLRLRVAISVKLQKQVLTSAKLNIIPLKQKSKPKESTSMRCPKQRKLQVKNSNIRHSMFFLKDWYLKRSKYVQAFLFCFFNSSKYYSLSFEMLPSERIGFSSNLSSTPFIREMKRKLNLISSNSQFFTRN